MNSEHDWQEEGESDRAYLGIDGTAGDAQDVAHTYIESVYGSYCRVCGLAKSYRKHESPPRSDVTMICCPSCGGEDIAVIHTACMDMEWGIPNGEVLAFSVCANCDYGINEHTEGLCHCPKEV